MADLYETLARDYGVTVYQDMQEKAQVRGAGGRYVSGGGDAPGPGASSIPVDPLKALEQSMHEKYPGTTFDFTGLDHGVMVGVCGQVDKLAKQYPEVMRTIPFIGTSKTDNPDMMYHRQVFLNTGKRLSMDDNAFACATPYSDKATSAAISPIYLNPRYFGDAALLHKLQAGCAARGWNPPGASTPEATFTHEFGHAVYYTMKYNGAKRTLFRQVGTRGQGTVAELLDRYVTYNTQKMGMVSGYARSGGPQEGFAESFAAMHHTPSDQQKHGVPHFAKFIGQFFGPDKQAWRDMPPPSDIIEFARASPGRKVYHAWVVAYVQ